MSKDMVNHPEHYETNGIECIDAMVASQGKEAVSNYCVCNAFKYIWRHQHKGKSVEDIQKSIWYLNKYVEFNEDQDFKYEFTEAEINKVLIEHKNHQEVNAHKLIYDLSKLNPIFLSAFPYWENDHILSIYSNSGWMQYPLYRFDFNKITRGKIIDAFSTEETPDNWDGITDLTWDDITDLTQSQK